MSEKFKQKQINQVFAHIPRRTLLFWADWGLLGNFEVKTDRRGKLRIYTIENLYRLGLVEELTEYGFTLESIQSMLDHAWGPVPMNRKNMHIDRPRTLVESRGRYMVISRNKSGPNAFWTAEIRQEDQLWNTGFQSYLTINLGLIMDRVDKLIREAG